MQPSGTTVTIAKPSLQQDAPSSEGVFFCRKTAPRRQLAEKNSGRGFGKKFNAAARCCYQAAPGSAVSGAGRVAFVRVMLYALGMRSRGLQKGETP